MEALYSKYKERGLVVLGFPSNDFADQEPGTEKQIRQFCINTYSVKFPMFEKSYVREGVAEPLYQTLGKISGDFPRWNFHEYLLDRSGKPAGSFSSRVEPNSKQIVDAIEQVL